MEENKYEAKQAEPLQKQDDINDIIDDHLKEDDFINIFNESYEHLDLFTVEKLFKFTYGNTDDKETGPNEAGFTTIVDYSEDEYEPRNYETNITKADSNEIEDVEQPLKTGTRIGEDEAPPKISEEERQMPEPEISENNGESFNNERNDKAVDSEETNTDKKKSALTNDELVERLLRELLLQ